MSTAKMTQCCSDLAALLRDLQAASTQPDSLKQVSMKMGPVVSALTAEANQLPSQYSQTTEACEQLKMAVVKFLQQTRAPTPMDAETAKNGIVGIAIKLRDASDKIKAIGEVAASPTPAPRTPTTTTTTTAGPPRVRPKSPQPPVVVSPKSPLSQSAGNSPASSRAMDFPIAVRLIMNQREEVKETLTSLLQGHKESNSDVINSEGEKLKTQVKKIIDGGKDVGCDVTSSLWPLVEALCSRNTSATEEVVKADVLQLNSALKDVVQTYKNFNKEKAKQQGGATAAKKVQAPAAGGGGNVQSLVNELKGLVQEGDPLEKYTLLKKVGEGASGAVWKAEPNNNPGDFVAIKQVELNVKTIEGTLKEIRFMSEIHHPHALEYRECWLPKGEVWIVMEFCDGGSVSDILETLQKPLAEIYIAAITQQSLLGLEYLHAMRKIHRDIKAANLLLTSSGQVKIADFGTSAEGSARTTVIGTFMWMAPETIDARGHDSKADIWSFGITLVEMAELYPPYWHLRMQPRQVAQAILREPSPTLKKPTEWSPDFVQVTNLCLLKDPQRRPTAVALLKHPFVAKARPGCLVNLLRERDLAVQKAAAPAQAKAPTGPVKTPHMLVTEQRNAPRPSRTLPRASKRFDRPPKEEAQIPVTILFNLSDPGHTIHILNTATVNELIEKCQMELDHLVPGGGLARSDMYLLDHSYTEFHLPSTATLAAVAHSVWSKVPDAELQFLWK